MKLIALALLPSLAEAGGFDVYEFNETGVPAIHVQLTTDFQTTDGCNDFGFKGTIRDASDANSLVQLLVADVANVTTEMGCAPLPHPRHVHLESRTFSIRAIQGRILARVLVPHELKLRVVNNPVAN